jgi:hypothetical protein
VDVRIIGPPGAPNLLIAPDANWDLFDEITTVAQRDLGGTWLTQLDGTDQRYWDLQRGPAVVTFHLDTFAGILAFPAEDSPDPAASLALLDRVRDLLAAHRPAA